MYSQHFSPMKCILLQCLQNPFCVGHGLLDCFIHLGSSLAPTSTSSPYSLVLYKEGFFSPADTFVLCSPEAKQMLHCLGFCWDVGWMRAAIIGEWGPHRHVDLHKEDWGPPSSSIVLKHGFQGALVSLQPVRRVLPSVGPRCQLLGHLGAGACLQFLQPHVAVVFPCLQGGSQLFRFPFSTYSRLLFTLSVSPIPIHVVTCTQKITSYRFQLEAGISKGGVLISGFKRHMKAR